MTTPMPSYPGGGSQCVMREITDLPMPITELYTQTRAITAHPMKTKAPSAKPFGIKFVPAVVRSLALGI
jgi:hypothetical protein